LINGNAQPLVQCLESFFTRQSIRAVLYLNESALQTVLEAFWFQPSITELCLLADPAAAYGAGRYKFADMFILGSYITIPCLEFKSVPLTALWRGIHGGKRWSAADLEDLRREITTMQSEEELLCLQVKYFQRDNNRDTQALPNTTIKAMFDAGTQQVKDYLELIRLGKSNGSHRGICDSRVECQKQEGTTSDLYSYVVIAISATKVLTRKVVEQESEYTFRAVACTP